MGQFVKSFFPFFESFFVNVINYLPSNHTDCYASWDSEPQRTDHQPNFDPQPSPLEQSAKPPNQTPDQQAQAGSNCFHSHPQSGEVGNQSLAANVTPEPDSTPEAGRC
jgi:hypothetical protein